MGRLPSWWWMETPMVRNAVKRAVVQGLCGADDFLRQGVSVKSCTLSAYTSTTSVRSMGGKMGF